MTNEEETKRFKIIRDTLEARSIIVDVKGDDFLVDFQRGTPHFGISLEYYIAPKIPKFTVHELQAFMESLFLYVDHGFNLRKEDFELYHANTRRGMNNPPFIEFGQLRIFCTITYDEYVKEIARRNGGAEAQVRKWVDNKGLEGEVEREFTLTVRIKPYPSEQVARDILSGELKPHHQVNLRDVIRLSDLKRYEPLVLDRYSWLNFPRSNN